MLKKLLLLTLCLVCLLCGCGQSSSATRPSSEPNLPVGGDFKFWLSEGVTCKAGENCTVEIRISGHSNVCASDLIIDFDSTKLSFESFAAGSVYISEGALQREGKIKVTSVTLNPPAEETVMGTLTFKAAANAKGEVPLKLTSETCANYDGKDMTPVCFGGSIVIE